MAHDQISDELVEVVVEGLQRRGAPCAAINGQDVQLHVRGSWMQPRWRLCILKMSSMQRLSSNWMPRLSCSAGPPKVSSRCRLIGLTCPATTVEPPLLLGDPLDHLGVSQTDHPMLPLQLEPLG